MQLFSRLKFVLGADIAAWAAPRHSDVGVIAALRVVDEVPPVAEIEDDPPQPKRLSEITIAISIPTRLAMD